MIRAAFTDFLLKSSKKEEQETVGDVFANYELVYCEQRKGRTTEWWNFERKSNRFKSGTTETAEHDTKNWSKSATSDTKKSTKKSTRIEDFKKTLSRVSLSSKKNVSLFKFNCELSNLESMDL